MSKIYPLSLKNKVLLDRHNGMGIDLLARKYQISKSTLYYWVKDVVLPPETKLQLKTNSNEGRRKGRETCARRRMIKIEEIKEKVAVAVNSLDINTNRAKILCSFLYWAEGSKDLTNVGFTNSDPMMIKTYLGLLRKGFNVDEKKLRCLVHLHAYHDRHAIESFWSVVTKIPLSQFTEPYLKQNSGINIKSGYKGCLLLRYYDAQIAKELYWLYTTFHQTVIEP